MSIYREEAVDVLIMCLRNSDYPASQIAAAETILALEGRFSYSGKPLIREFLLKRAGLDGTDNNVAQNKIRYPSNDSQETTVSFISSSIRKSMIQDICQMLNFIPLLLFRKNIVVGRRESC